jgi:putative transport protein
VAAFLAGQPLLVLFVVLAAGTVLGSIRFAGVSAGPAGALFVGLALSAVVPDVAGIVPPLLGTLGLTLFAYTVGLAGGTSFFAGLRGHAGLIALASSAFVVVAVVAHVVGGALGLGPADIAGVYAGSVTNTPGLAAAVETVGTNQPVVGYSLAYPFGVLGIIAAIVVGQAWWGRHPTAEDRHPPEPASYRTVEVDRDDAPTLGQLERFDGATLVFSRIRRDGLERTPVRELVPQPGDILTVIGPRDVVEDFTAFIGRPAADDLALDRHQVDFRRVVVSNPRYAGVRIGELGLDRFDAVAGFVRRGDAELVARPELVVELGDRIRVIAPRDRIEQVVAELGGSERAAVTADPLGFSLGLVLGLGLGVVPIPLPGVTLQLGSAAAPLLVGLVLGRVGHTGSVAWQLPYATNQALRQLGALLFLATIGLNSGPDLVTALASGQGARLFGLGLLLTTLAAAALVAVARALGLGSARLAGTLAGAQNQPAILSFAVDRTDGDDRVNLAYALLFPPTFVVKILCAQLLASL